jgi:predicted nucleic acid-binding protein
VLVEPLHVLLAVDRDRVTAPGWLGWGPGRLRRLDYEIARAETVWPGPHVVEAYASLRTWCVRTGHGLGQKEHEADRWVAATAIWLQVPLVAHDGIFANVKDLELLTKLGD